MNDSLTLARLRTLLRWLTVAILAGTVLDLLLLKHFESPWQLVPYGLCGLGLATLIRHWQRPSRQNALTLRIVMTLLALGSVTGGVQHVLGNLEFARETMPSATAPTLLLAALLGRNPLLAPSILAVTGVIAVATTYSAGRPSPGADAHPPDSPAPASFSREHSRR